MTELIRPRLRYLRTIAFAALVTGSLPVARAATPIDGTQAKPTGVTLPAPAEGANVADERPLSSAAKTLARSGDDAVRGGNFRDAARDYASAAEIAPHDPILHEMLGVALSSSGHMDQAIPTFRRAVKLADDDLIAGMLLQSALSANGNADEAQALFQEMHRRFAPSAGNTGASGGLDASQSIGRLKRRLEAEPNSGILYLLLGDACQLAHDWTDADSAYDRASRNAPQWSKPLVNHGLALLGQGQTDRAITVLNRAVGLDPGNAAAKMWLGDAELHGGRSSSAVKTLKAVVGNTGTVDPQVRGQAAVGLAQAYSNLKDYPHAVESLEMAQRLAPADPTAAAVLGDIQLQAGNFAAATSAYQNALRLSSASSGQGDDRPVLYRALAEAQITAHHPEDALQTLHQALVTDGDDAGLWHRLIAQIHFDQGDTAAGEEELCLALDSENGRYPFDTLNAISAHNLLASIQHRYETRLLDSEGVAQVPAAPVTRRGGIYGNEFQNTAQSITVRIHSAPTAQDAARVTIADQANTLATLASIARFQQNRTSQEIELRLRLSHLRDLASDWYMLAEAYDLRARTPIPAREAYSRALALKTGLTPVQIEQATKRLNVLTGAVYKP